MRLTKEQQIRSLERQIEELVEQIPTSTAEIFHANSDLIELRDQLYILKGVGK
jgi:hypothetical protein